jgi:hypothetical protein
MSYDFIFKYIKKYEYVSLFISKNKIINEITSKCIYACALGYNQKSNENNNEKCIHKNKCIIDVNNNRGCNINKKFLNKKKQEMNKLIKLFLEKSKQNKIETYSDMMKFILNYLIFFTNNTKRNYTTSPNSSFIFEEIKDNDFVHDNNIIINDSSILFYPYAFDTCCMNEFMTSIFKENINSINIFLSNIKFKHVNDFFYILFENIFDIDNKKLAPSIRNIYISNQIINNKINNENNENNKKNNNLSINRFIEFNLYYI